MQNQFVGLCVSLSIKSLQDQLAPQLYSTCNNSKFELELINKLIVGFLFREMNNV
jgi:hypothetical protein